MIAAALALVSGENALAQAGHVQGHPALGGQKAPSASKVSNSSEVADMYQCVMKCEGDKTYPKPGKCPVCSMTLKKLTTAKYTVEVKPTQTIRAGERASLVITIKDPDGKPVTKLETVHERIVHLLVVSKDLSWFSHEHPQMRADGTLQVAFAFPAPGEYMLYHDFTPPDVGQQVVRVAVTVPGEAPSALPPAVDSDEEKHVDGYAIMFSTKAPPLVNEDTELVFRITKDGKPVTDLQPYLGAMGHLVIISEDLEHFVHSHPLEVGAAGGHSHGEEHGAHQHGASHSMGTDGATGPDVRFHAHFEAPGLYKAWGQFQHGGKVLTVPVVLKVEDDGSHEGGDAHGH